MRPFLLFSCLLRRNRVLLPLTLSLLSVFTLLFVLTSNLAVTNRSFLVEDILQDHQGHAVPTATNLDLTQREMTDNDEHRSLSNWWVPPRRVVHLDLKGAAPRLSYLQSLLPLISASGATHLLIEYEDMFPYSGKLANLSNEKAYTRKEVHSLLATAKSNGLRVIPLVQTFGHLEFALKLSEFEKLREVDYYPQSLCPSNWEAFELVTAMIEQVVEMHPDSSWIHVGCDEVFQLGLCPKCSERIESFRNNEDTKDLGSMYGDKRLFVSHVHHVASHVRSLNLIPIVWDDMLRSLPSSMMASIANLVEPMVWVYVEDVDRFVDSLHWSVLKENFEHVWAASAFKGAFGETLSAVHLRRHVENSKAWLEVMRRESELHFRGIVLTGWSRYDHFAVLCELLPTSVPSLVLNTLILSKGRHDDQLALKAREILQCGHGDDYDHEDVSKLLSPSSIINDPWQWDVRLSCHFSGGDVFNVMHNFEEMRKEIENVFDSVTRNNGWMSDYNVKHRFSAPQRVIEVLRQTNFLPDALQALRVHMDNALHRVFDTHIVQEWLEQHVDPLERMLKEIQHRGSVLMAQRTWPRRPLVDHHDDNNDNHSNAKDSTNDDDLHNPK